MSPTRAAHVCSMPSCSTLVRNGPRCPAHAISREERNPKDPAQQKHYNSTQWKAVRAIVRRNQPICMKCKRVPSTTVHHLNENWRDNRLENLEAWCARCHNKHSGTEHQKKRVS